MSDLSTSGLLSIDALEVNAIDTAGSMLGSAEGVIDAEYGSGYAEKHPALVAGFLQACAVVYLAEHQGIRLDDLLHAVKGVAVDVERIRIALETAK